MKLDKTALEFFRKAGSKGGKKTKKLYGITHYKKMSELSRQPKLSTATPLQETK